MPQLSTPNERTRRRLEYAVRRRESLVELLAPDLCCAECGTKQPSAAQLVIDHVDGVTWNRYTLSPQMRAARYWREYHAGIPLRALCNSCSATDGNQRRRRRARRW